MCIFMCVNASGPLALVSGPVCVRASVRGIDMYIVVLCSKSVSPLVLFY